MGRERSFSEQEVVDRAADLFATHGYAGTSMAMLLEAAGLGRQSLYNAFGDKRELYLRALDCWMARFGTLAIAMRDAGDGRAAVGAFFARLQRDCASDDPARRHCMVSGGLLEGIPDEGVEDALRARWEATRTLLRDAIARGQRDGSIARRDRPDDVADLLISLMSGLRVSARAGMGVARQRRAIEATLALLDTG